MKNFRWLGLALAVLLLASFSSAQSLDAFLGFNTLVTGTSDNGLPKLGGGFYPTIGGNLTFLPHGIGVGAQVAWRASQADYFGSGVRPIYYTFNLTWNPIASGARVRPDLAVGFGAQSLRFYEGTYTCTFLGGCTDYSSSNHIALHLGVGVKLYATDHIFVRPAVDYYNIHNNAEFGVPSAWQVGIGIGYTLGPSS